MIMVDAMFRYNTQGFIDLSEDEKKQVLCIEFEDFLVNSDYYIKSMESFIGEPFGKAKNKILRREHCPRVIDPSERPQRREAILSNIGDSYKEIFIKLIDDYDKKPWLNWQEEL